MRALTVAGIDPKTHTGGWKAVGNTSGRDDEILNGGSVISSLVKRDPSRGWRKIFNHVNTALLFLTRGHRVLGVQIGSPCWKRTLISLNNSEWRFPWWLRAPNVCLLNRKVRTPDTIKCAKLQTLARLGSCAGRRGGGCKRWNEVQQSLRVDWEADNVLFCLLCVNRAKPEKVVVDFRDRQRHILFTAEDDPHLLPDVRRLLCGFSRYTFPRNCRRGEAKGDVLARRRDVVTMVTQLAHATPVFISLSAPPGPAFT